MHSILEQTFTDFELLIIDDGSTDGTSGRLADFAGADSRIRPLRSGGSGIVAGTQLRTCASKRQVYCADGCDDIALPSRFELQVNHLEANPGLVACGTAVVVIDAAGKEMVEGRLSTDW